MEVGTPAESDYTDMDNAAGAHPIHSSLCSSLQISHIINWNDSEAQS